MNQKNLLIHIIGSLLAISAIIHSFRDYTSLLLAVPFILISISVEFEEKRFTKIFLVGISLILPYFLIQNYMSNYFSIMIFIITLVVPLILYWIIILSPTTNLYAKGLFLSGSYIALTLFIFYIIIFLFNINDYILTDENTGPQALVLMGSALIAAIPFHVYLNLED